MEVEQIKSLTPKPHYYQNGAIMLNNSIIRLDCCLSTLRTYLQRRFIMQIVQGIFILIHNLFIICFGLFPRKLNMANLEKGEPDFTVSV